MKVREFNRLLKEKSPGELISQHMSCKIFLTEKQLQKCIDLKSGTSEENRGSTNFNYGKKESKC